MGFFFQRPDLGVVVGWCEGWLWGAWDCLVAGARDFGVFYVAWRVALWDGGEMAVDLFGRSDFVGIGAFE